jgi:hypothetical protein
MATRSQLHWSAGETNGPELMLAGAAAMTAGALLLSGWKLPAILILPVVSGVLLLAGFVLAAAFWRRPAASGVLSYRDVAGMLVFFGFMAALLVDTSFFAALFDSGTR